MYNRLFQKVAAILVVTLLGSGVVMAQQSPVAGDAQTSNERDSTQFARGAQTWANTCARCHNIRDPKELRADQWRAAVAHMRVRSGLTGGETRDVLAFLQGGADAQAGPVSLAATATPRSANENKGGAAAGEGIYAQTCIACHGADGKGPIPGVADFTAKDSPLSKTDEELVKNISEGFQSPGSFMAMPAKGGNPSLTEEDIRAVVKYLRSEFGE
jgi:mono/diheme cytochrome c family protein